MDATKKAAPYKALVFGGTGAVGKCLVTGLRKAESCTALTTIGRREYKYEGDTAKLSQKVADMGELAAAKADCVGHDIAYCCLGTTRARAGSNAAFRAVDFDMVIAAAKVCKEAGIEHFCLVSSVNANHKSFVPYSKCKGQSEEEIAKIGFGKYTIFRPSVLIAKRDESRLAEDISRNLSPIWSSLLFGPVRKYRAITVEDVAAGMIAVSEASNDAPADDSTAKKFVDSAEIQRLADATKDPKQTKGCLG